MRPLRMTLVDAGLAVGATLAWYGAAVVSVRFRAPGGRVRTLTRPIVFR